MRVRLTLLLSTWLLVPAVAFADGHKAGLTGGGAAGSGGSGLFGFHLGFEHKLPGKVDPNDEKLRWQMVLADVGVQFGSDDGQITQVTYMAGARYHLMPRSDSNRFFVHGLLGVSNTNHQNHGSGNDFVYAFGGGYERFFDKPAGSDPHLGLGFHAQVDVIIRDGPGSNDDEFHRGTFTRVSAGVVYRFRLHQ